MPPVAGGILGDENRVGSFAEPGFSLVPLSPWVRLVLGSEGTLDCCFEHECQSLNTLQAP